uniref:Uncharacterized protein n=1 Tax=Rhizophora mucronata TaxID=61149 RepID=A0A2P2PC98_RHIMU
MVILLNSPDRDENWQLISHCTTKMVSFPLHVFQRLSV